MENEVVLFVLGDFYPEATMSHKLDQFDFSATSNEWINKNTKYSDLCIVNLESPITNHNQVIPKTGPALKGNISGLQFLNEMGCNMVTLANNHIMDYGKQGLEDTCASLKSYGIDFVGAGMNKAESTEIKYINKNDLKIAILNFAENEWSTSTEKNEPGASGLDEISNFYDIQEAKKNADKVVVITHGGHEMYSLPSPRMKKLFRFFVDSGADAVINHHTHCISGFEVYKDKPIFYSLGNFIFNNDDKVNSIWNIGMGVRLILSKQEIKFEIQYFKQCDGVNLLSELTKVERQEVIDNTDKWNSVISSDLLLEAEFNKWVMKTTKQYNSYIEPQSFRLISSLQYRGWIPSFWTNVKRRYLLNLIRCEAHKDVLISILKNENSNTQN